jgi:AraC family transcriptional regulator, ethanolamine operon transcriptional activator
MVAVRSPADSPWKSAGTFHDIDAQAAQYQGYDQRYQQLSPGRFEGHFSKFKFSDDLIIGLETANRELAVTAVTPDRRYGACFLDRSSPPCKLNAVEFSENDVALAPENKALEGKTPEGLRVYCLDFSPALFTDAGYSIEIGRVVSDPARSRRLREWVQSALATFTTVGAPVDYPAASCAFQSSLAELLSQTAAQTEAHSSIKMRRYATAGTLRAFRRARDYIHQGLSDGLSIATLCRDTGVSRRSLEYVFRSVVGIGPGRYIRLLRLNCIHQELRSQPGQEVSIGIIAARNGIWHWSRFSRDYRMLFGELPSQTRLRAREA